MKGPSHFFSVLLTLLAQLFVCQAMVVSAQENFNSASDDKPLTITVTAQKREQPLQKVGIAVTHFSAQEVESLGFESSTEIVSMTPGVHLAGSFAGQSMTYNIRGVSQNDFLDHGEAPTAVYIDEGYISMMNGQVFTLFDINRIEILKGPQSTLFGRNATGGTVHFITNQPTDTFESYSKITRGSYQQKRFEGAISGPLQPGVTGRFAVLLNQHDPILNNQFDGADDEWNDRTWATRAQLKFDLDHNSEFLLSLFNGRSTLSTSPYQSRHTIAEVNSQGQLINSYEVSATETREGIGPGGVNTDVGNDLTGAPDGVTLTRETPGGDFFGYRDSDGDDFDVSKDFTDDDRNELTLHGLTGKYIRDYNQFLLTTITDYKATHKDFMLDGDASPARWFENGGIADVNHISQEVRFDIDRERSHWLYGLYFLHIHAYIPRTGINIPEDADTPALVAAGLGGFSFLDEYSLKTDSLSLFNQIEYDLTSDLTVITGLRATLEQKEFDYRSDTYFQNVLVTEGRTFNDDYKETLWSGRAQLNWFADDNLMIYGGYNRGVKAGSYNAPYGGGTIITDADIPYDSENLNAYEIGFKSNFIPLNTRLNATLFYYDYRDYQAFKLIGLTTLVTNNDAETKGIELELITHPATGVDLGLSAAYTDATVKDVEYLGHISDKSPTFTPQKQVSALVRYQWVAFNGLFTLQGESSYSSSFYYSLTNFDSTRVGSYILSNLRLSYETIDAQWRTTFAIENLTDERYATVGFDLSTACGCSETAYGPPRWVSLSVKYTPQ